MKTDRIKRIVLICLLNVTGMFFAQATETCEVQVVSAENYGLELDWAIQLKSSTSSYGVGINSLKYDSDGNFYCVGHYKKDVEFPGGTKLKQSDNRMCSYVAKFTANGELLWCKDFYASEKGGSSYAQAIYGESKDKEEILIALYMEGSHQKPASYYYGEEKLTEIETNSWAYEIISLSVADGTLKKSFLMKKEEGVKMPRMVSNFEILEDGDYLISAYIDTTFTGTNGFNSECRSSKDISKYLLRLDSDFNVKWDYAYATQLTNIGFSARTDGEILCVGDTLYHIFHYEAEDFNLNPEGTPILVNRENNDPQFGEAGSIILKCDISGEKPQLLGYWHSGRENTPITLEKNSKGEVIASMLSEDNMYCSCVKLSGNLTLEEMNGMPFQHSNWWWTDFNPVYSFGEEDNIYILGYNCCDPLSFQFSEESDTVHFKAERQNYMISKYGADSSFHVALATDFVSMEVMDVDDKSGSFTIGAKNEYYGTNMVSTPIDWNPLPDQESATFLAKQYVDIVKYVETYRIKPIVVGDGEIILQDSFVRFGGNTSFKAIAANGAALERVVTSHGELFADADGNYHIDEVKEVVEVKAYFSSRTTGLADSPSDDLLLYPNPATDYLRLNGKADFTYQITDLQGKSVLQGYSEDGSVSVKELPAGNYIFRCGEFNTKFQISYKLQ